MYVATPSILLLTATSLNMVYALVAAAAIAVAYIGIARRSSVVLAAAGVLLAVSTLLAFELAAVGCVISGMVIWSGLQSGNRRSAFLQLLSMWLAFVGVHTAVYLTTGFNIVEAFQVARQSHAHVYADERSYPYWTLLGNPVAFLTLVGAPASLLLLKATSDTVSRITPVALVAIPVMATLLAINLSGVVRGETERLFLFLVPWVVIAACGALPSDENRMRTVILAAAPLAFLQAFLIEVFLDLA
jgi:hypothetical protein